MHNTNIHLKSHCKHSVKYEHRIIHNYHSMFLNSKMKCIMHFHLKLIYYHTFCLCLLLFQNNGWIMGELVLFPVEPYLLSCYLNTVCNMSPELAVISVTRGSFYEHGLTLIPVWISNYIYYKLWDEIIYPFLNFNGCNVEVYEWISNFIPHFTGHVITYLCWD